MTGDTIDLFGTKVPTGDYEILRQLACVLVGASYCDEDEAHARRRALSVASRMLEEYRGGNAAACREAPNKKPHTQLVRTDRRGHRVDGGAL